MNELSSFFNEKMKLMVIVSEHLTEVEGEQFCPLNQQEIASLVPCGKVKANQLIQELIKEGYLDTLRIKGRYCLTERGKEILNKIK
ncbi:MAG: hypothetical protein E7273_13910 [Pseudobutyrivibrio ruminis]|nr:hypothetical protein [Pseudobutyrivibrio ruminis]